MNREMNEVRMIWSDGKVMPADELRVSPFDLGLAVGWGAFETMAGYDGKLFRFSEHYERLRHSASVLGICVPEQWLLRDAVREVLAANDLLTGRSRVRIYLSGGEYSLQEQGVKSGLVVVNAVALPEPDGVVRMVVSDFPHNERSGLSGAKTSSYGNNLLALRKAVAAGADEALLLNTVGHVCECATSNVFLVKDGVVLTPSLASGCLAGVTRAEVLDLCQQDGIEFRELELDLKDVQDADEVFLTSSTREVQAAVLLGEDGTGSGDVTKRLAGLLAERVREEAE